ncbi:hypothetical protein [Allorhodopirellula solitaria]|uniref:PSP1 C-terminal domain-containing protein n=1 Tax=Allorhodopirellula solitaria TaxID=2527987 RepID=A0A5C5YCB3_9BACT|nr:hypothetical protein [Allorhodopirellula solitaria]TWT73020.1 hypothetical protein CA85_14810 [Allorhodopirellula solitaria]
MAAYLVRIGFAGDVFVAASLLAEMRLSRRSEVLVQTPRGVELGEVLGEASPPGAGPETSLSILRELTADDRLLVERLQRYKRDAVRRCQDVLAQSESAAVLLDVDQLFDGNSLVLHFLGPVDALGRELTDAIVAEYESQVQSIRLSELMTQGCGPGCGSEAGGGCGSSGGCASCAVAGACKVK